MSEDNKYLSSDFEAYIATLCAQLGIPEDYGVQRNLRLQPECSQPVSIGKDMFDREQFLTEGAADAWWRMHKAAAVGIQ